MKQKQGEAGNKDEVDASEHYDPYDNSDHSAFLFFSGIIQMNIISCLIIWR